MGRFQKAKYYFSGVLTGAILFSGIAYAATSIDVDFLPLRYYFDGVEKTPPVDQSGFVYNGRTYVSLRFIGEALGKQVGWDENTDSIYIGQQPQIAQSQYDSYVGTWNQQNPDPYGSFGPLEVIHKAGNTYTFTQYYSTPDGQSGVLYTNDLIVNQDGYTPTFADTDKHGVTQTRYHLQDGKIYVELVDDWLYTTPRSIPFIKS